MGALATVVAALAPTPARADSRKLRELSLEELLDVEVVTPTAKVQRAEEAPATIFVVTAQMIRDRGYRDLRQLLEDVPGVNIDRNSAVEWGDHLAVRGLVGSPRLIVLLDGLRVTSAAGNPHSLRQAYSLTNIERVEVVLGPASALYGADAFTGVVHMISIAGAALDGGSVTGSYGRFDTTDDAFAVGGAAAGVGLAVWGNFYHSEDPTLPDFYRDEYAWYHDRYRTNGEVRVSPFAPPDQTQVIPNEPYTSARSATSLHARLDVGDLRFTYARLRESHASSTGARPEFSPSVHDARWAFVIESLGVQHRFTVPDEPLRLTSTLSFQRYTIEPSSAYVNAYNGYTKRSKYGSDLVVRFDQRGTLEPSERLAISAGLTVETTRALPKTFDLERPFDPDVSAASQGLIYPGTDVVDASGRDLSIALELHETQYRSVGAYAEVVARPHDAITATAGVRLDHDTRYGETLNPRAGVVLAPFADTRVKLLYGEAYLAPSPYFAYQHYGVFTPTRDAGGAITGLRSDFFFLPNPDLEPEKLRTGELSIAQALGAVRLGVNAYYTRVAGLLIQKQASDETFRGWPIATVGRFVNQGTAEAYGGALTAGAHVSLGPVLLRPSLAYALTDGEQDGVPLGQPRHTLKGILDVAWRRLSVSTRLLARGRTRSAYQTDADGQLLGVPGSAIVNLHARWGGVVLPGVGEGAVFVSAENLFDQRYFHFSDGAETFLATPQDPLRVLVGVTIER